MRRQGQAALAGQDSHENNPRPRHFRGCLGTGQQVQKDGASQNKSQLCYLTRRDRAGYSPPSGCGGPFDPSPKPLHQGPLQDEFPFTVSVLPATRLYPFNCLSVAAACARIPPLAPCSPLEAVAGTRRRRATPTWKSQCTEPAWAAGVAQGCCRWAIPGVLLALTAGLLTRGLASEYDYVSFQSDFSSYLSGRFYAKPPQCVDIPADLRLCHNVGYERMLLPNVLKHETMAEVKQQASSWVPLLNKNCHVGTQVFLCSLFTPVCLNLPIYPCCWLCEAVRNSCEPVMQFLSFCWPEMLKCDKFPEEDVCIAMTPPDATEA
ncbi:PREDICTED: LOW QUALITY PROTEIN: secreted frizzled-related protein 1-like [Propithecus coquereli]|uniref:LOW QUALITY PROTEIN: secreted frizzled-related protein 1-like n=1 Tax=Propithecus coquereli TaxID=379532 RepID=UPI00063F7374|nr:PREDICTED: LOW QUALITY PROTEIN: secreted frizzled-related protein 1-like [Propithecus coquereli]